MARLDRTTGRLVVRIAYDGPPLAGKTATLRALGRDVEAPVVSFEEAYGRTLWFDWLTHRGGMYGGRPIECEVAAVPGQAALEDRRHAVLDDADAVVLVADTSPTGQAPTLQAAQRLDAWRRELTVPPGVVVQANKQDVPGAWTPSELRDRLHLAPDVPVVASVAEDGRGVRHAFVFAVRLAVRRADAQRAHATGLPVGAGPVTAAEARAAVARMTAVRP